MSSDFENLPLPVNRDAQDYSRLVPPNSAVEIPVVGEFVYCKFSDGSIRVVINGKSTLMESGDERRSGGSSVFRGVTLINDTENTKTITFVIGFGKFDRKIIQGNITIQPGVRKADGSFSNDERRKISLAIFPKPLFAPRSFGPGDLINSDQRLGESLSNYSPPPGSEFGFSPKKTAVASNHFQKSICTFATAFSPDYMCYLVFSGYEDKIGSVIYTEYKPGGNTATVMGYLNNGTILISDSGVLGSDDTNDVALMRFPDTARGAAVVQTALPTVIGDQFAKGIFEFKDKIHVAFRNRSTDEEGLYIFDQSFNILERIDIAGPDGKAWASDGNKIYSLTTTGSIQERKTDDFSVIATYALPTRNIKGITLLNNRLQFYKTAYGVLDWLYDEYILVNYSITGDFYAGSALGGCPNISRKPKIYDTGANINYIDGPDGGRVYSGEIVKAVLDVLASNKQVSSDYKDHVYSMLVAGDPLAGFQSKGATMAAAGIEDNFTITLPGTVTIEIDNGLTYQGF